MATVKKRGKAEKRFGKIKTYLCSLKGLRFDTASTDQWSVKSFIPRAPLCWGKFTGNVSKGAAKNSHR